MSALEIDQYEIETTWSKSAAQQIVKDAITYDDISIEMENNFKRVISDNLNGDSDTADTVYNHLLLLLLADKADKPIQAVATQLGMVAGCVEKTDALVWGIQVLKATSELGLFFLEQRTRGEKEWFVCSKLILDKTNREAIENLQFLPPMKIRPFAWNNNTDGGWAHSKQHLMLGKSLGKHDEFLCYDVINTLQEIPWELDHATLSTERQTNHTMNKQKFLRVVNEYMNNSFHFVWRYDSRGRMYSSGYDLNIQSNEYGKALLSKANKEIVPLDKLDNMYIALANHAGKDKLTWSERIEWAKGISENEDCSSWEEPMLGRKALRAFNDVVEGKPTGYVMSLDATSSGELRPVN